MIREVKTQVGLVKLWKMKYDFILGMDWLSTHHAHVDSHQKRVTSKMEGISEFTYEGVKDEIKMQNISAIKATKLLKQGC